MFFDIAPTEGWFTRYAAAFPLLNGLGLRDGDFTKVLTRLSEHYPKDMFNIRITTIAVLI